MENILLTDFNTPFETVPFSQINNEDFRPAIEKGITLAKEEIEAIKNNGFSLVKHEIFHRFRDPQYENSIVYNRKLTHQKSIHS